MFYENKFLLIFALNEFVSSLVGAREGEADDDKGAMTIQNTQVNKIMC